MDVRADEAGLRPDPSATAIVEQPVTDSQGQLFGDTYPTYADTDKIPAVRGRTVTPGPARWLRVLVILVALVVVAAGASLALVKAGVIDTKGTSKPTTSQTTQHPGSTPTSKAPLVTQVSTGNGTATYRVALPAYAVTVITTTGRSWVSIGAVGQRPAFAGIVNPNSSQRVVLLGPSTVDVGAGGTKLIITSEQRTQILTPPSAPFSYSFVITK
jgi:hypothetical protein